MATSIPTRRSPRSIEHFCHGVLYHAATVEQCATLLALAHSTSWSAERTALNIRSVTRIVLTAEEVYRLHSQWIVRRGTATLSADEFVLVQTLLAPIVVILSDTARPLNLTPKPVSHPEFPFMCNLTLVRPQSPLSKAGRQGYVTYFRRTVENEVHVNMLPEYFGWSLVSWLHI